MKEAPTGKEIGVSAVKGRFLTPKEIAPFLRKSERWVQARMSENTFPIRWYDLGPRGRVVDSEDLNNFLRLIAVRNPKKADR